MRREWIHFLALALAYYLAGRLGLLSAIPPGYATAIWPASGIALAGLLLGGARFWPAILLGSFLVNIANGPFGIALILGLGAALQAVVASVLVRRHVKEPFLLLDGKDILTFLLLSGPLSCIVSATVGVTTLSFFHKFVFSEYWFNWLTWWVGDCMGAMIIGPLVVLYLSSRHDRERMKRSQWLSLALSLTFVIIVGSFLIAQKQERKSVQLNLDQRVDHYIAGLQQELSNFKEALHATVSLVESVNAISEEGFHQFTEDWRARHPEVFAVNYTQAVEARERDRFPLIIKEFQNGHFVPAQNRERYFPVRYVSPANEMILGFDLASEPRRKAGLTRALETGTMAITEPFQLIGIPEGDLSFLTFAPVYRERGKQSVKGFIVGILQADSFFQTLQKKAKLGTMRVVVRDAESRSPNLAFGQVSWLRYVYATKSIPAFGRTWDLTFGSEEDLILKEMSWVPWFVLTGGFLLTGLMGALLLTLTGRSEQVRHMVDLRTKELKEAQATIFHSAKLSALGKMAAGVAHEINNPLSVVRAGVEEIDYLISSSTINREECHSMVAKIETMVVRISKIIAGLKSFAREGAQDPMVATSLQTLVDSTLELCQERMKRHHIDLVIENTPNIFVSCRPSQIAQVLVNLLNNSCDAVTDMRQPRWIRLGFSLESKFLVVSVSDSGPGIPKDIQEQIMHPFFTTKPVGVGTGLGLSISKGLVESHGGKLYLKTEATHTTFCIEIPTCALPENELPVAA